jgi:hypothetical protein
MANRNTSRKGHVVRKWRIEKLCIYYGKACSRVASHPMAGDDIRSAFLHENSPRIAFRIMLCNINSKPLIYLVHMIFQNH